MKRCVIVGGAGIKNYSKIKEYIKEDDFFVYCDGGLNHISGLGHEPNLIIGDFDSHDKPDTNIETIVLPCEKDDTDTCFALKECIKRGFDDITLVGCIGERFDHTMGNVSLLIMIQEKGLTGRIIDDYSEMSLVGGMNGTSESLIEDKFSYFSLISLSDDVKGVTIKDAKYPLENAEINSGFQYGISNEVIKGKTSKVSRREGNMLLIKVF